MSGDWFVWTKQTHEEILPGVEICAEGHDKLSVFDGLIERVHSPLLVSSHVDSLGFKY